MSSRQMPAVEAHARLRLAREFATQTLGLVESADPDRWDPRSADEEDVGTARVWLGETIGRLDRILTTVAAAAAKEIEEQAR
jgi:hypothetical protein